MPWPPTLVRMVRLPRLVGPEALLPWPMPLIRFLLVLLKLMAESRLVRRELRLDCDMSVKAADKWRLVGLFRGLWMVSRRVVAESSSAIVNSTLDPGL